MRLLAFLLLVAPVALMAFAYVAYPLLLWLVAPRRRSPAPEPRDREWPFVSITVPAYNSATPLRATLDHLVAVDYPEDRREIVVVSDASTDDTDAVALEYAPRGVRLVRMPARSGKTAVENHVVRHVRGEIVVNVDATILIPRDSLKPLIRAFDDPTVGVSSGRDVSVDAQRDGSANGSESGYVGYEMWLRGLETRCGTIIGASGCFFAFRRFLHEAPLPEQLSWDFATPLVAREHGLRSVSVDEAVCLVPRTPALRTELTRKMRTMARGLDTLLHKRALMNPFRYGRFALMLLSHKLFRWLPYLLAPVSLLALAYLAFGSDAARLLAVAVALGIGAGVLAIRWPRATKPPRVLAVAGYSVAAFSAGFLAWISVLQGQRRAIWEPTPR